MGRLQQIVATHMEDVGRCWKTWLEDVGSLAKSLGRRDFDLKKKKSFFSLFKFEIHVFQAILRGFPTSSSNVFQRLPTSSMCVATILGVWGPPNLYLCKAPPGPCLRVAETKPESDYPADMLGKGTSAQLSLTVFDKAAVYMPNGHAQHPDMGTVDGK